MNKEILEQYINEYKTIKEMSKLLNKSISTIRYWLEKFELKTKNKKGPKTTNKSGVCLFCQKETINNRMYCSNNCKTKQSLKNNPKEYDYLKRKNFKQLAVNYKGGKCSICSYNKNLAALSFHHLDPNEKDLEISKFKSTKNLSEKHINELNKCILLCSNCHREVHNNLSQIPTTYQKFDESLLQLPENIYLLKITKTSFCPVCNKQKDNRNKYCSLSCAASTHSKINWDLYDIVDMIENQKLTKIAIAEIVGCSDAAVGKRYRKLKAALLIK